MKTLRLGIIGAENSHSWSIANLCNNLKKVPLRVTHIWGETEEFAAKAAERGAIPNIVSDWKKMLGEVDGIMIDHRDGKEHTAPAKYFIQRGLPTFVDKPITCSLSEAKSLFKLAEKSGAPVITFGAKPIQKAFVDFSKMLRKQGGIRAFNTSGPSDLDSKYSGIFFYGIHQVDGVVDVMGEDAEKVSLIRQGDNGVATIFFRDGRLATLNLIKQGGGGFHWRACTDHGIFSLEDKNDEHPYLPSVKLIADLVKNGKVPFTRERMLAPIAILEALQKSLISGKVERVAKL